MFASAVRLSFCLVYLGGVTAYRTTYQNEAPCGRNEVVTEIDTKTHKEPTCELRNGPYGKPCDKSACCPGSAQMPSCESKCICKPGFFRNYLGDCISAEQCDKCRGQNEFFSCGTECDNVCSTLHEQNRTNCPLVNVVCNERCYCKDGFARDKNQICVPVEQCPNTPISHYKRRKRYTGDKPSDLDKRCGDNEEYKDCKQTCPPELCFSIAASFKCSANPPCEPGCACKPGYLRKSSEEPCIAIRYCPELINSPDYNPK